VVGSEPAQFSFALADLAVELVDQAQARFDRALPRLEVDVPFHVRGQPIPVRSIQPTWESRETCMVYWSHGTGAPVSGALQQE
jgi:hypothetical protein